MKYLKYHNNNFIGNQFANNDKVLKNFPTYMNYSVSLAYASIIFI